MIQATFTPALQLWPAVQSKRRAEFFHRERFNAEIQLSLTCPLTCLCCERHKHIVPGGRRAQTTKTMQARVFQPFPEQRGDDVLQDTDGQEVQAYSACASRFYSKEMIRLVYLIMQYGIKLEPGCNPNGSCCDRSPARLSKSLCLPNPKCLPSIAMPLLARSRPRAHQETRHSTDRKRSCNLEDLYLWRVEHQVHLD